MKEALSFLSKLEKNNNRDWFLANKKEYTETRRLVLESVEELIKGIHSFDKDIIGIEASKSMFRINRDVRFSANKNPYKNNMGAYFSKGGKNSIFSGYYFHIQPGNSFIAAGVWMPESKILNAIRQEIHFNHETFRKILKNKKLVESFGEIQGDQLKTAPKGYEKDHPAIDLLRYKSLVLMRHFSDKELTDKDFIKTCVSHYKNSAPFIQFINEAIALGAEQ